jgi:hypothetical protein
MYRHSPASIMATRPSLLLAVLLLIRFSTMLEIMNYTWEQKVRVVQQPVNV